ncbi:hypothetical protein, partial [Salmonella enterica]|uniref:hypothetical protein n=1 Tax=Salmonella enterica TaxID=28901 RepID=UPI001C37E67D
STHYNYWFLPACLIPSGFLCSTGGVLPGLSLLLLSPTLFILTIRSIAFRRFGIRRTCPRRTLFLITM